LEGWLRDEFEGWLVANGVPSLLDEARNGLTLGLDEDRMQYVLFEPKPNWKRWRLVEDIATLTRIAVGVLTFTTLLFLFYVAIAHPIVGWLW
jgi:hypothetical protein